MSITITDPQMLAQLTNGEDVQLIDPSGRVLGRFIPEGLCKLPPGVVSPFSEEEMAKRRQEKREGRPLADILRDLEARG